MPANLTRTWTDGRIQVTDMGLELLEPDNPSKSLSELKSAMKSIGIKTIFVGNPIMVKGAPVVKVKLKFP